MFKPIKLPMCDSNYLFSRKHYKSFLITTYLLLFTTYLLRNTKYLLPIHFTFATYTLYICYLYIIHLLPIRYTFATYTLYIYYLFITIYNLFMKFAGLRSAFGGGMCDRERLKFVSNSPILFSIQLASINPALEHWSIRPHWLCNRRRS